MTPKTTGDLKTIRHKLQMIMLDLYENQKEADINLVGVIECIDEADTEIYNALPKTDDHDTTIPNRPISILSKVSSDAGYDKGGE